MNRSSHSRFRNIREDRRVSYAILTLFAHDKPNFQQLADVSIVCSAKPHCSRSNPPQNQGLQTDVNIVSPPPPTPSKIENIESMSAGEGTELQGEDHAAHDSAPSHKPNHEPDLNADVVDDIADDFDLMNSTPPPPRTTKTPPHHPRAFTPLPHASRSCCRSRTAVSGQLRCEDYVRRGSGTVGGGVSSNHRMAIIGR